MSQPTIRERIRQIQEYGLPHIVEAKNTLTKRLEVIGILDGNIPEVSLRCEFEQFPLLEYPGEDYASAFSEATGRRFSESYFIKENKSNGPKIPRLQTKLLETHAFYDPNSDMTHYFVLPSRKLLNESQ